MNRSLPLVMLLLCAIGLGLWWIRARQSTQTLSPEASHALAVLGDSDSHAYQDRLSFPAGTPKRGGPYRSTTLQWTEVLARLRGTQLDQGPWGVHGTRGIVARINRWIGREGRSPPKQDYRYNFALSGADCSDLLEGYSRQTHALLSLMRQQPGRWRNGVVVIRIGINSFGDAQDLDQLARDPRAPAVQGKIAACVQAIGTTVDLLHRQHPEVRIVLVGIFDNADWARNLDRWRDPAMLLHIWQGLDVFDQALAGMAARDARIAFFDDRAWFTARWGTRDAHGVPAYRVPTLGGLEVRNAAGDSPDHAVLADGHAGTAWNAEWARALVDLLNARFDFRIDPVSDAEIAGVMAGARTSQ